MDDQGRLGYLASDCVMRLEHGRLGEVGDAGGVWPSADLFPPGRYPRGFAAPECFDPKRPRDQRSDWFAWAAVAYLVLTGELGDAPDLQPEGEPWFHFHQPLAARPGESTAGAAACGGYGPGRHRSVSIPRRVPPCGRGIRLRAGGSLCRSCPRTGRVD